MDSDLKTSKQTRKYQNDLKDVIVLLKGRYPYSLDKSFSTG